uniref:Uncharacterized protein n=1 Tax=Ditylenchus dipsaci TaxID=166011 RepID=A0A915EPI4_9BILA
MSNISERLLSIVCRLGASCNRPDCPFQHFREVFQGESIERHRGTVLDIHGDDYFGHYMKNLTKSALSVPDASNDSNRQPSSVVSASTNLEQEDATVLVKPKDVKNLPLVSSAPPIQEDKITIASQQFSSDAAIARKAASKQEKEPNARIKIRKRLGQTEFFDLPAAKKAKVKANPRPSVSFDFAKAGVKPAAEPLGKEEVKSTVSESFVMPVRIGGISVGNGSTLEKELCGEKPKDVDFQNHVEETSRPIIEKENVIDVDCVPSAAIVKKKIKKNGPQKAGRRIDSEDDEVVENKPRAAGVVEAKQVSEPGLSTEAMKKQQKSFRLASKILVPEDKQDPALNSSSSDTEEEKIEVVKSPKWDKHPIVIQQKLPVWKASPSTAGIISLSSEFSNQEKELSESKFVKKSPFDFHFNAEDVASKNNIGAHLVDVKNSCGSNEWPLQAKIPLARTESNWHHKPRPSLLPSTKKVVRQPKKSQLRGSKEKPSISVCLPINSQNQMVNYQARQNCVDRLLKAHLSVANTNENQAKEKARQDESNILNRSSTKEAYFKALTDHIKRITEVSIVRT